MGVVEVAMSDSREFKDIRRSGRGAPAKSTLTVPNQRTGAPNRSLGEPGAPRSGGR